MSSDRQLNYVNNLQNRDQNLYYVDDASELNSINLEENDKIYAINDNKLFQMEIVDQEEELSGSIVSFNGRNNTKIKSLVANIEPQQDLHGYENPWPAGGGTNKFDESQFTEYTTGGVAILLQLKPNTTYVMSTTHPPSSGTAAAVFFHLQSESISTINNGVWANHTHSLTTGSDGIAVVTYRMMDGETLEQFKAYKFWVNEEIATIYSPYSNSCPISGWTRAEIEGTGKNLLDPVATFGSSSTFYDVNEDGSITVKMSDSRGWNTLPAIPIKKGTYTFSRSIIGGWADIRLSTENYAVNHVMNASELITSFTMVEDGYYKCKLGYSKSSYPFTVNAQIELGSTATDYGPFQSNQIFVTFPSSAGTVYGAMLTINPDRTGQLVVDRAIGDLGTMDWSRLTDGANPIFVNQINNKAVGEMICSRYKYVGDVSNAELREIPNCSCAGHFSSGSVFVIRDDAYSDAASFKAAVASSTVVYKLAAPITYALTESEISGILTTFYGTNNIWADTGDITVKIAEKGKTAFELKPYT